MAPPEPSTRAEWGGLNRDAVVRAAVELLEDEGMPAVSVRAVAGRLGVSAMALYRHVSNKDDLLDEAVDLLFADRWEPQVARTEWQQWVVDAADRLRAFLVEQPAALHVYLRHPVVAPTAARRMDACLVVLREALHDDARAQQAYAAIQSYTIGFAALEAGRGISRTAGGDSRAIASHRAEPARARLLASSASPAQFRAGLGYLLRGMLG